MANSTPTQSDKAQVSTAAAPGDWQRLANLTNVIRELSGQQCIHDLQHLFQHADSLKATVKEQETVITELNRKLLAQADEVKRLVKEHKDRQEEVTETHTRLLRRRDDEKVALNQEVTRQGNELYDSKTSMQHLKEHVEKLNDQLQQQTNEIEKIEAHLRQARSESKQLYKSVQEQKEHLKLVEQQWQTEKKAHGQSKSQVEALNQRYVDLEAEVKAHRSRLDEVEKLAPPLTDDNMAEATKALQKIWTQCVRLHQNCFREDTPAEQLNDSVMKQSLQRSHLMTHAVPLPPTNSATARRMRLCATLAIVTDSLVHHLFTSTYLFDQTVEVDRLMLEMAEDDPHREALFRRLMNSKSAAVVTQRLEERVERAREEVIGYIQPLLSAVQTDKLTTGLTDVLKQAGDLWQSLRRRQSCFAVETQQPSEVEEAWKSLTWDESKKSFVEENVTAPVDVVLVLFPRIIALNHEHEQVVFPGVVLLKAETKAALTELNELPPTSPIAPRSGPYRSAAGRRGTRDRKSESGAFLAANGSPKPSAS